MQWLVGTLLATSGALRQIPCARTIKDFRWNSGTPARTLPPSACAAYDDRGRRLIPWGTARRSVHRLSLRSESEWWAWVQDNKPGITSNRNWLLPDQPDEAYPEWQSWDDWLGVPLSYSEACAVVAELGVASQEHWWAFARERADLLGDLRVPALPHLYYSSEWQGYDEWLALPGTPLVLPKNFGAPGGNDD